VRASQFRAWARRSHEVSAVTTPLFVAAPMVQVVLGYFPLAPNRWFGIGFAAYYLLATPLLYKARPCRPTDGPAHGHRTVASAATRALGQA